MTALLDTGTLQNVYTVQQDALVFICGQNVTNLVQSINVSLSPFDKGGNTCTVVLQNPNDVLTITTGNLGGQFLTQDTQQSSYVSTPWQQEYDESIKRSILTSKQGLQRVKTPGGKSLSQTIQDGLEAAKASGHALYNEYNWHLYPEPGASTIAPTRWDLYPGCCIFNTNDPIRVFLRHPTEYMKMDSGLEPVWYYGFTGYLVSVSVADNLGEGAYNLVLTAEGAATRMLRLSRMTHNYTGYLDVLTQSPELIVGDIVNVTGFSSLFTSLSMPQLLGTLVVGGGTQVLNQYGPQPITEEAKVQGIGRFKMGDGNGGIQLWNPEMFQGWQSEIHPKLTEAEALEIGRTSGFGPDEDVFSSFGGFSGKTAPDLGRLHILLPDRTFEHFNQIVEIAIVTPELVAASEFDSRLDVITKYICNYLLYSVQETPKGDVVAEFPFYDYLPYDLGDYGKQNLINDETTSTVDLTEDDNKAYTWIVAKGGVSQVADVDAKSGGGIKELTVVGHAILVNLIPRYGIRVFSADNPVMRTPEAVRFFLKVICAKVVADIRSSHSTLGLSDPSIICNRPYLLSYKNVLGLLLRVSHSVQYQQSASTTLDLNYVRLIHQEGDGTYKFMLFGGDDLAAKPLAYATIGNVKDPGPIIPHKEPEPQPKEEPKPVDPPAPTGKTPPPTEEDYWSGKSLAGQVFTFNEAP